MRHRPRDVLSLDFYRMMWVARQTMRKPNHTMAEKYVERNYCPLCEGVIEPNYEDAYIQCVGECGWSGVSYKDIGAFS